MPLESNDGKSESTNSTSERKKTRKPKTGSKAKDPDSAGSPAENTKEDTKEETGERRTKKSKTQPAPTTTTTTDTDNDAPTDKRKSFSLKRKKKHDYDDHDGHDLLGVSKTAMASSSKGKDTKTKTEAGKLLLELMQKQPTTKRPKEASDANLEVPTDDDLYSNYAGSVEPGFEEVEEPQGRAARRARGKSVYLSCFAGIDSIYFIIRLVIFLRLDIFHDAAQDAQDKRKNDSANASTSSSVSSEQDRYYCYNQDLEKQCAWIFSVTWLCYFLSIVSLILSVVWLSLKLCYTYVIMKTTSIILHFLGLVYFGTYCLSQKFYLEAAAFFIIHLPLQIFGTKRTRNYALWLKKAEIEKVAQRTIPHTSSHGLTPTDSGNLRRKMSQMQPRQSYARVTTVDV